MRLTIALGGNAILKPNQKGRAEEQFNNVYESCKQIVKLVKKGNEIIITHGNGPQVGNILLQQSSAENVPELPLDFCGAQTQGFIGYMIQNSLFNIFKKNDLKFKSTSIVTQVLVDQNDSAFENPSKPVGPFFNKNYAKKREKENGEKWIEDSGRGWRRVVPSPTPKKIIEKNIINNLIREDRIVIAAGGGGVPVVQDNGDYKGVEAVIDKDHAGCMLAEDTNSDIFLILTDIDNVMINYGSVNEEKINKTNIKNMNKYLENGQFAEGSMKPKVEAAIKFVKEKKNRKAIITSLDKVEEAIKGKAGTVISA